MTDGELLLRAVLAHPDDDAARLVYADWLQENGQEDRAEFVRVQVELARPVPEPPASLSYSLVSSAEHVQRVHDYRAATARRAYLERRERELLSTLSFPLPDGWAIGRGLGTAVRGRDGDLFLRRGFGERALCPSAVWVAAGDALLAEHPITRVRLTSYPLLREDATEVALNGDPRAQRFAWETVRAARRPDDPDPRRYGWYAPLLRLRYGERIAFELPGVARK